MAVLEAIYRVECPRSAWFAGVLAAVGAALKGGDWVGGVLYDVSRPRIHLDDIGGIGMPEGWLEIGKADASGSAPRGRDRGELSRHGLHDAAGARVDDSRA
jgi:hypothetical protein